VSGLFSTLAKPFREIKGAFMAQHINKMTMTSNRPSRATATKAKAPTAATSTAKAVPVADAIKVPVPAKAKAAASSVSFDDPSANERDMVFGMSKPKMTETQLLKSVEDDYMNAEQLNFFKYKLLEVRSQILANASDTGEHLRENEVTTDPADRATQEEEYTLELRTRDRERKLLKKVERSLRMIEEGTYGWCEESGEPIGLPRLLARPTATLSLEAQERRERMQKLYGD
jgi:DnaK suppressor protein